ncbi:MAG: GNAT family N-acetyltransferase [Rhodothalassiaceae bacterium]
MSERQSDATMTEFPDGDGVAVVEELDERALGELCEATALAVADGEDIAWVHPPKQSVLAAYWKGILLAPHRRLLVARHDGRICGAVQLILPGTINEAGAHAGEIATFFVAPWARGHGNARALLERVEAEARAAGLKVLDFSIRADRKAGIALVESLGYRRWAEKPHYAFINGAFVPGYFYTKTLNGAELRE